MKRDLIETDEKQEKPRKIFDSLQERMETKWMKIRSLSMAKEEKSPIILGSKRSL